MVVGEQLRDTLAWIKWDVQDGALTVEEAIDKAYDLGRNSNEDR